jgi:aspartate ammonia-lyase
MQMDIYEESLAVRERHGGKLATRSKVEIRSMHDLVLVYTPGVAAVARKIAETPDAAFRYTVQAGQIDLNVMTPVMTHAVLESLAILNAFLPIIRQRCVGGIHADEKRLRGHLDQNRSLATLLAPRIGYLKAAEIVKEAQEKVVPVRDVAVMRGVISKKEADRIFDPHTIARSTYR